MSVRKTVSSVSEKIYGMTVPKGQEILTDIGNMPKTGKPEIGNFKSNPL